jgi:hypothetical protein
MHYGVKQKVPNSYLDMNILINYQECEKERTITLHQLSHFMLYINRSFWFWKKGWIMFLIVTLWLIKAWSEEIIQK